MKLVVFCLFAVCCYSLANTATNNNDRSQEKRKLAEVLRQLNLVKQSLQHNEKMLNTPPQDINDCCCLPALKCFQDNLMVQFNITERNQRKLYQSLGNYLTKRGVDFCTSGNDNSTCQDCASHPKKNATVFFNRLESLIQKAIVRLS